MKQYFIFLIIAQSIFISKQKDISMRIIEGSQEGEIFFNSFSNESNASIIAKHSGDVLIQHNNQNLLKYNQSLDEISSDYNVIIKNNIIFNDFSDSIKFNGIEQWKLFYDEDFQGSVEGWSKNSLSSCGETLNLFLGGYCNFGKDLEVSKTFENLPRHSKLTQKQVMINFNFNFIDNWKGETAYARLDNKIFWQESYQWCNNFLIQICEQYGINVCGQQFPDRINHQVSFASAHNEKTLTLSFSTTLNRPPCEVSWGIDDIQIFIL